MGKKCRTHGTDENAYNILVGKPEGKRLLGRPRVRWEDTVRMDLREIGWRVVYLIHLAQHRDQWRALVKKGNEISGSIKGGEFLE